VPSQVGFVEIWFHITITRSWPLKSAAGQPKLRTFLCNRCAHFCTKTRSTLPAPGVGVNPWHCRYWPSVALGLVEVIPGGSTSVEWPLITNTGRRCFLCIAGLKVLARVNWRASFGSTRGRGERPFLVTFGVLVLRNWLQYVTNNVTINLSMSNVELVWFYFFKAFHSLTQLYKKLLVGYFHFREYHSVKCTCEAPY
jgi:hypothetical protein